MTKRHFLEFEQPIAELESKIEELRYVQNESAVDISEEIDRLDKKSLQLTKDIYSSLQPWQVYQIARHPQRPQTLDYTAEIFTEFQELHGDRSYADDAAIVGGLARFNGQACMVVGHQRGYDTKDRTLRNFGMPRPEGYRKAQRLMQTAENSACPSSRSSTRWAPIPASAPRSAASRKRSAAASSRWRSSRCRSSRPSSARAARAARWPSASATSS
jgi:acetyl-CoA carboxylase carboxyl transferase subunit alpha